VFQATIAQATQLAITQATSIITQQVLAGLIPAAQAPAAIAALVPSIVPVIAAQLVPANAAAAAKDKLVAFKPSEFKPETVRSYELGYKGLFGNKLLIDAYAYFNSIENFIGGQVLVQDKNYVATSLASTLGLNLLNANTRNIYSLPTNRTETIKS
jgi:hypothetical protein